MTNEIIDAEYTIVNDVIPPLELPTGENIQITPDMIQNMNFDKFMKQAAMQRQQLKRKDLKYSTEFEKRRSKAKAARKARKINRK